jgi:hypothetical protein
LPTTPGIVYDASFALLTHTGQNFPNENLTGNLTAKVVDRDDPTKSTVVLQRINFNGGTDLWQSYSALLTQTSGNAQFQFLIAKDNPLYQGHLLFANVSVTPQFDFQNWMSDCSTKVGCTTTTPAANALNLSVDQAKLTVTSGSFAIAAHQTYTYQFITSNANLNANSTFRVMDSLGLFNFSIDPSVSAHSFSFNSGTTSGLDTFSFMLSDVGDPSITVSNASFAQAPGPIPGAGLLSYLALAVFAVASATWKRLGLMHKRLMPQGLQS